MKVSCISLWVLGMIGALQSGFLLAHAASLPSAVRSLPDFDLRQTASTSTAPASQPAALAGLQAALPDARVDLDEILGTPKWIASNRRFLTGPDGQGTASATLARIQPSDPDRVTKAFLSDHRDLFGHGPEVLTNALVKRRFVTAHNGLQTVVWQQQLDGITVFDALLVAHTTAKNELAGISSRFIPDPPSATGMDQPTRVALQAAPPISAAQAIALAARSLGETLAPDQVTLVEGASPAADREQKFRDPLFKGDIDARLVWLPMNRTSLRLCWEVLLMSRARDEMFQLVIDARTGEAHIRHCLTENLSNASYNVFTGDSPTPMSPGWPSPNTNQPAQVSRVLVVTNALDTNASPAGWINDGGNETQGNNVDAHLDTDGDGLPDLPRPQGSPFRVFNPPLDLTQDPATNGNAAVVNLFYWNNWMHDKLYDLGFTEAAGNFQSNNFSRGGLGNDAVSASAQEGGSTSGSDNNARFTTPRDGQPGLMQMYIWTGPTPHRDGDLDTQVILHEYTHGLSNRRVGGGAGITAMQSKGLGEGWSDFYSLALLAKPGDDVNGTYPEGSYVAYQYSGLTQNYYYGIRRYPYCTDMTRDPVTFKDIDPNQADPHTGVPLSPVFSNAVPAVPANEIHNVGEIWCAVLWDARANLVNKYGFTNGNQAILQIITDGMNLTPANPDFVQARDAIILADLIDTSGANYRELWTAFARRGLGYGAVAPANSTTYGVTESYLLPDDMIVTPPSDFNPAGAITGPFSPASQLYTVKNTGTNFMNWSAGKTAAWLTLTNTGGTLPTNGASATVLVSLNTNTIPLPVGTYTDTVSFTNITSGAVLTRNVTLRISPPQITNFSLSTDPGWSRQGQWAFGTPTGQGGAFRGHPDPGSGATGTNVFGVNLNGDYSTTPGGPYYLTTGPLNFAGSGGMVLQFQRWLNSDAAPYATATIDISSDDTNWSNVYSNSAQAVTDGAWTNCQYDISAAADNQATVYVRWGYQITAGAFPYSGWNIDDVSFLGLDKLLVQLPASATKGDGVLTNAGRITVLHAPAADLTVALASSDTDKITVPPTVTIPAGQTNVTFDLTIIDNMLLDGTESAAISATANDYASGTNSMLVYDNETAVLGVSLPASATEGDPPVSGTVTSSAAPAEDITVSLFSSNSNRVQVPTTIVLPAGQTSVNFQAAILDDHIIDGDGTVTVTAHVRNWTDGSAGILVHDIENTNLVLKLPALARQSNGVITNGGRVQISGFLTTNLPVTLVSADTNHLLVPSGIVISTGQTSAVFNLTLVGGAAPFGTNSVQVSAAAPKFTGAQTNITLVDNQSPPAPFNPSPPNQSTNNPVNVQLSWSPGLGEGQEQLANGDFESGSFTNWIISASTNGSFVINDGTISPPSGDGPTTPFAGNYSALADTYTPGTTTLYHPVTLPTNAATITLSWVDRIRNFDTVFASDQQFRVEIRDTNDIPLAVVYSTQPGDPLLQDWTPRSVDLTSYAGQTIRVAFVVNAGEAFLDVHLDNVSVRTANLPAVMYDVYFGTNAVPDITELQGSTTNAFWPLPTLAPLTPYYWQIVARRTNQTAGPVWQFASLATLSVTNLTIIANNAQVTNAVFNLRLDAPSGQPVSVDFATVDGSAVAPGDYAATNGTLTFNPGETNKTIPIPAIGGTNNAPNKTFFLVLTNPVNLLLGATVASATVINDDGIPPSLSPIPDFTVDELTTLQFTNSATDTDPAGESLIFSLDPGAPTGAGVNAQTGVFTWTASDAQASNTFSITVRVTDSDPPNLSDAKTFHVTVNKVNQPPVLTAIPNQAVHAGTTLSFTAQATDPESPPEILTFTLNLGAPAGAGIGATNGIFTWTPGSSFIGTTNNITVTVTDNGTPNKSDSKTFSVIVVGPPQFSPIIISGGHVLLTWSAVPGQVYRVQYKTSLSGAWNNLPGDVTSTGMTATKLDPQAIAVARFYRVLVLP